MLDQLMLKELGVASMREALCILKQAKEVASQTKYTKAPTAKLLQLNLEMTPPPNNSVSSELIGISLPR